MGFRRSRKKPARRVGLRRDPLLERQCVDLLRTAGCRGLVPRVVWNPRLKTTAGLACSSTGTITLNPKLLDLEGEVQRTLRHELAHLLAQFRAGGRRIPPHGNAWRKACSDLGIPGEPRCHSLPFKRTRITPKYFYACRCCGTVLKRVRRIRRPLACLKCCRHFNRGRYSEAYRFVAIEAPDQAAA